MAEIWELPADHLIKPTGKEWLFQLLHSIPEHQRAMTLLTFWRIWHAHNEITHDKPCPSIESSRRFLVSYLNSLLMIKQYPDADITKGKMVVDQTKGFRRMSIPLQNERRLKKKWSKPSPNIVKLNVDGAYKDANAGVGAVVRDHQGAVILAACRQVLHCHDATEAELMAIEDGLKLTLQWTTACFTVETDCSEALELIKECTPNTSPYAFRINIIRELLRERDTKLVWINREANMVSHELAKLGRVHGRTMVWLGETPSEICDALSVDCNSISD
jgi:ribonuclease HI